MKIRCSLLGIVFGLVSLAARAATGDNASFVSMSVPQSMAVGGTYQVSVTFKNTGTTTWTAANNYSADDDQMDNTAISAPYTPQTTQNNEPQGLFSVINSSGALNPSGTAVATANPSVRNAAFLVQSVPSTMTHGQQYPVTITVQNTGNTTWAPGALYRLGAQNPQDSTTWAAGGRVNLNSSPVQTVGAGQQVTFTFTVTAPSTPGTYNFQWQMVEDGVGWFGPKSTNVAVAVK